MTETTNGNQKATADLKRLANSKFDDKETFITLTYPKDNDAENENKKTNEEKTRPQGITIELNKSVGNEVKQETNLDVTCRLIKKQLGLLSDQSQNTSNENLVNLTYAMVEVAKVLLSDEVIFN